MACDGLSSEEARAVIDPVEALINHLGQAIVPRVDTLAATSGGAAMRRWAMVAGGVLLLLLGLVWTLQGVGVLGGSPMTGVTLWALIGPVVGIAGLLVIALGLRRTPGS